MSNARGLENSLRFGDKLERRLGRGTSSAKWDYESLEEILREMASVNRDYAGVTYERIEKVGLIYPVPDLNHPGTPTLFTETFLSGRGKFHVLDYVPVLEEADDEYPFILTMGPLLEHGHGIANNMPVRVTPRRGEIVLHATVTEKTPVCVVFIHCHFAEAAANLLTNDVLDLQALIPEFKACAVQVFPAREDELAHPEVIVQRGRY